MGMALRLGPGFHGCQTLQDAAGIYGLFGLAVLAQGSQLLLEVHQLLDARFDMGDVLVKNGIDGTTTLGGLVGQA